MKRIAILVLGALLAGCGDGEHVEVRKEWPAPTSSPSSETSQPVADASSASGEVADDLTSGREAGKELSRHISNLALVLDTNLVLQKTSISKMIQAAKQGDDAAFTEEAVGMKDAAHKAQDELNRTRSDANVSDEDAEYFNDVSDAANEVIAVRVELAVDFAAMAHTGIDMLDKTELRQLAGEEKQASAKLRNAAKKGYAHFGIKASEVDWKTLQMKQTTNK